MNKIVRVAISNTNCNFVIKVNDIEIYDQVDDENVTFGLPINEWLLKGRNVVELILIPLLNQEIDFSKARASLMLTGDTEIIEVYGDKYKEYDGQIDKIPELKISFSHSTFKPGDYFSSLQSLNNLPKPIFINIYKEVIDCFLNKDQSAYIRLFEKKIEDMAQSYGLLLSEEKERQLTFFHQLIETRLNNPNLLDFNLKLFMNNKVAVIVNAKHQHPLTFVEEGYGEYTFPIWFGMSSDDSTPKIIR